MMMTLYVAYAKRMRGLKMPRFLAGALAGAGSCRRLQQHSQQNIATLVLDTLRGGATLAGGFRACLDLLTLKINS
jgi:hypothetical protein